MTAKKKAAKKRKPKAPARKKASKPKRPWPPFGCGEEDDERAGDAGIMIDPDPIPFTKVRYRNNGSQPTIVSVVVEKDNPPDTSTMVVPRVPGLVQPGEVVDLPPQPPCHSVCQVHGTVLFSVGGQVHSHAFGGPWMPYVDWVEIETKLSWPNGTLYTEVTYHFQPLV